MAEREYNAAEEAYFKSYQKHKKAGLNDVSARVMATKESGTTPKLSWAGKLKNGIKKELARTRTEQVSDQLKKSGLSQEQIDRLKGK